MYRGRYFIREQIWKCGAYIDADIYPVYQKAGKRRKRCKPSSEIQKQLNRRNAEKRITRLIHCNFTGADIVLHLTYDAVPDPEEANRYLANFLRRIKRHRKKHGMEPLKYISSTEIGKKSGRIHHHVILNGGIDRDTLEKLWGHGYANSKRLQFREDGITGLAHYVAKDKLFYKHWNQSRNLIQPQPEVRDAAMSQVEAAELRRKIKERNAAEYLEERYGYRYVQAGVYDNGVNHGVYIHVEMKAMENQKKRGGRYDEDQSRRKNCHLSGGNLCGG